MKRYVVIWMVALLTAALSVPAAVAAAYDDGQFSLDIPASWFTMQSVQSYERVLIASPWPVAADQVLQGEDVDSGALLSVVIGLTPAWLQEDTLQQAVAMLQDSYRGYATNNGETFAVVAPAQDTTLDGLPAVEFTIRTGDTTRYMVLAVRDGYIFRLETAFAEAQQQPYEAVMADIAASFRIKGAPDVPVLQPRITNVAVLPLPPEWHMKHHEKHQSFVSREKIDRPEDIFYTGVTLFAIPDYAAAYGMPPNRPDIMYQAWLAASLQSVEQNDPPGIALDVWLAPVDGIESLFIDSVTFDSSGLAIQTLQVATVKDDHFFVGIFEAPVDEYFHYRPMFMQSIAQLQWVTPSR